MGYRQLCLVIAAVVGVGLLCIGQESPPAGGYIEISFRINDPLRYPDEEPLEEPQTVVWLEDSGGNYAGSLLVSDWLASGGYAKKIKTSDGKKVPAVCAEWQAASGWPKGHSKKTVDVVSAATPQTGTHTVKFSCADLGLKVGSHKFHVQTSVAEGYYIMGSGTIDIGGDPAETTATVINHPKLHKDAGPILTDVKAAYSR